MPLDEVNPWGRSFEEYCAIFALSESELARRILDCGAGPAAFNAELTERGGSVVSCDPIYEYSAEAIGAPASAKPRPPSSNTSMPTATATSGPPSIRPTKSSKPVLPPCKASSPTSPKRLPEMEYPVGFAQRRVHFKGVIDWRRGRLFLGERWKTKRSASRKSKTAGASGSALILARLNARQINDPKAKRDKRGKGRWRAQLLDASGRPTGSRRPTTPNGRR